MSDIKPVSMNVEDAQQKIISGQYTLPKGSRVNVINPDGETVSLPAEQVRNALADGYKLESPNDGAVREYVEDNKGVLGALKVGIGQAVNQLAMDIPQTIFDQTQDPLTIRKKEALKDDHAAWNVVGGVTGFAGSLFAAPTKAIYSGAAKIGEIAARPLAQRLAAQGMEKGAMSAAKKIMARTAENAVKLGVEGAVTMAPKAITEAALGDPNASAESLLAGGGFGAAMGIVGTPVGAALSGLGKKLSVKMAMKAEQEAAQAAEQQKQSFKVTLKGKGTSDIAGETIPKGTGAPRSIMDETQFIDELGNRTQPDINAVGDGTIAGDAKAFGWNDEHAKFLASESAKKKENVSIIENAFNFFGVKPTEGQLSKSKPVQQAEQFYEKRPDTAIGQARILQKQTQFDAINSWVKNLLNFGDEQTASLRDNFILGEKIKGGVKQVISGIEQANKPLWKAINEAYPEAQFSVEAKNQLADLIEGISGGKYKNLKFDGQDKIKNLVNELRENPNILTLDELKNLKSAFWETKPASFGTDKATTKAFSQANQAMLDFEEQTIKGLAESNPKLEGLFKQRLEANAKHSAMMRQFESIGDALGVKFKNADELLGALEDGKTNEQIAKAFKDKNDIGSLKVLQKEFPELFELSRKSWKAEQLNKYVKDGDANIGSIARELKKLTDSQAEILLNADEREGLQHLIAAVESGAPPVNPSNTGQTAHFINPQMQASDFSLTQQINNSLGKIVSNLTDDVTGSILQARASHAMELEGIFVAESQLNKTRGFLNKIPSILDNMAEGAGKAKGLAVKHFPAITSGFLSSISNDSEKALDKAEAIERLQNQVSQYVSNEPFRAEKVAAEVKGLDGMGAPNIAAAYSQKLNQAIDYVQQVMPKQLQPATPFYKPKFKPSAAEIASFERKIEVLNNPFVVFNALEQGTLTKDHVESLAANYPLLYQAMRGRMLDHLTENPKDFSYSQRLNLSLLMGFDFDQTATPQSILSYQTAWQQAPAFDQSGDGLSQSGLNKLDLSNRMMGPSEQNLANS